MSRLSSSKLKTAVALVASGLLVLWRARTLLVLLAGAVLVGVGAALVYVPAGLVSFGALLIAGALPDRPRGGGQ